VLGITTTSCLAEYSCSLAPIPLSYCTRFEDGCLAIVRFFLVCATMRPMGCSIALSGQEAGREVGQALGDYEHGLVGHFVG
jgi:hypothetical protein